MSSVGEGRDPCDAPAHDQSVDVMSPLVGVHGLQVHHVSVNIAFVFVP